MSKFAPCCRPSWRIVGVDDGDRLAGAGPGDRAEHDRVDAVGRADHLRGHSRRREDCSGVESAGPAPWRGQVRPARRPPDRRSRGSIAGRSRVPAPPSARTANRGGAGTNPAGGPGAFPRVSPTCRAVPLTVELRDERRNRFQERLIAISSYKAVARSRRQSGLQCAALKDTPLVPGQMVNLTRVPAFVNSADKNNWAKFTTIPPVLWINGAHLPPFRTMAVCTRPTLG